MKIFASITSEFNKHKVTVQTNEANKELDIAPKANGYGSAVNGGEFLMLALATCFCNDIYREAAKRNINVTAVDVDFTSEFGSEGEPGANFQYKAKVTADASDEEIQALIAHTDKIAEIHNTLRQGLEIKLVG